MVALRYLLACVLLSSCAGTCSSMSPPGLGGGAMSSGMGHAMASRQAAAAEAACDAFGTPEIAYLGCDVDGSLNTTLANNDPACTWTDSGSLGIDATQGTGTACPTFVDGGGPNGTRDALSFDGDDRLVGVGAISTQPAMIASVASSDSVSVAIASIVDRGAGTGGRNILGRNNSSWRYFAGVVRTAGTVVVNQYETLVATYDASSSTLRVSGTEVDTGALGTENLDTSIGIGSQFGAEAGLYWTGSVADVIVYDTVPAATDVEDHFATHHASTFPVAP